MFWFDGAIFEQPIVPFDLGDRGLLLGDGIFDTALVQRGVMFRGEAHLARLFDGLAFLGIDADPGIIRRATAIMSERCGTGVLRTTVTRGPGPRGLKPPKVSRPTILVATAAPAESLIFAPIALDVTPIRRNETSPTSRLKTLNYLDGVLAVAAAAEKGFDEALFLNCAGRVACAAAGNIFAVFGADVVTPPVSEGVLPGIIRGIVLAEAGGRESPLELQDLFAADAVFVTNSLRLIAPVTRIGEKTFESARNEAVNVLQQSSWEAIRAECRIADPFPAGGGGRESRGIGS